MADYRIHLLVQAGDGGKGCESFTRRPDRKLIAHGGDGGQGGHVIFKASHNAPEISRLNQRQHIVAESGGQGGADRKRGRRGQDEIILVPAGTRIYHRETKLNIRDLSREGDEVIVARGGQGGRGNEGGKKASSGQAGEKFEIEIEFFLPADVFLLGFPNTGKSTFLNRLTGSHIEVTDYPFSTHKPKLGVYEYDAYKQLVLCELPSVYMGSEDGRGLGTDFLSHLEKAKIVLLFLDLQGDFVQDTHEGVRFLKEVIEKEFQDGISAKICVAVNKIDLVKEASAENLEDPVFYISAKTGKGIDELMKHLAVETEALSSEELG